MLLTLFFSLTIAQMSCPPGYVAQYSAIFPQSAVRCCNNLAPGNLTCLTSYVSDTPNDYLVYCSQMFPVPAVSLCLCGQLCTGTVEATGTCNGTCLCSGVCCDLGAPCAPSAAPTSAAPTSHAPTATPTPAPSGAPVIAVPPVVSAPSGTTTIGACTPGPAVLAVVFVLLSMLAS